MGHINEFPLKKTIQLQKDKYEEKVGSETLMKICRTHFETDYSHPRDIDVTLIALVEPYRGFQESFLGILFVSCVFVDFLDQFATHMKRKGTYGSIHEDFIKYGPLVTAYRLFKQSSERFDEVLKESDTLEDFVALATIGGN